MDVFILKSWIKERGSHLRINLLLGKIVWAYIFLKKFGEVESSVTFAALIENRVSYYVSFAICS